MRRFLFVLFILLIISGVFFMVPERQAPSSENPYFTLHRIMQLSGATVVEGEFHYWVSLGTCPEIASLPDLEARADELLKRIVAREPGSKISGNSSSPRGGGSDQSFTAEKGLSHALYQPDSKQNGESPVYMMVERYTDLQSGGRMRLLLQRMEQEGVNIVHLLITVNQEGEARQLSSLAYRLPSLLGPEAQKGNLSFCLTGHLDRELSPEEMEELSLIITRDIGGEQVQSISDGKMVSVTGYTPDLGDYLRAENLRINLNLAMRYDDYLDKTVIWAGTPLISRYY
jgi:hypothetical protein